MKRIVFATNNAHKLAEVQRILGDEYKLVTPPELGITEDIPEEADTLQGNASQKAHYLHDRTREDCFADDTGLEVEALGGAPGVYSARYAGEAKSSEDNITLLLKNLEGKDNRRARFRTVISLIINNKEHLFEGSVDGRIIEKRHGTDGFGYDPVFIPDGYKITFAEMTMEQKNTISHRARAVAELVKFLKNR